MLFNSLEFFLFLPLVFAIFWIIPKEQNKMRNLILLSSSYVFYGWWDWRFLSLIIISSLVDFQIGKRLSIDRPDNERKRLLFASIVLNLGMLAFFKYCDFFIDNFVEAFSFFGQKIDASRLEIILPVGISFYTFQTLSYSIDIYRKKLTPSSNWISFFSFVSFFPQLVAGPIERATSLLPQFEIKKSFDYNSSVDGLRQILWGFFKKIVIADNCAKIVNSIFDNYDTMPGSMLVLGAILFAFQIYCDFSGYSDIAIGISRMFGFNLKKNFAFPYFSRDIAEFWRRWHISLSTWFRDYLYIPLGGSKVGKGKRIRNTFIIFIVSGFWHGPNWTFIAWGAINAFLFLPLLLSNTNRKNIEIVSENKLFPRFTDIVKICVTFILVCFAWIFFRAESINEAFLYISNIFNPSLFTVPTLDLEAYITLFFVVLFVVIEWMNRHKEYALELVGYKAKPLVLWSSYLCLVFIIIIFAGELQEFIYFQF